MHLARLRVPLKENVSFNAPPVGPEHRRRIEDAEKGKEEGLGEVNYAGDNCGVTPLDKSHECRAD